MHLSVSRPKRSVKAKSQTQAIRAIKLIREKGLTRSVSTENTYRDCLKVFCDYLNEKHLGDLLSSSITYAKTFLEEKKEVLEQKKLDQYKQAFQAFFRARGLLGQKENLPTIKSDLQTILTHRAYTDKQVELIISHQRVTLGFSTRIARDCGLRAHELLTIEPLEERQPDKRYYKDGTEKKLPTKFVGLPEGRRYVVTGKGGLTREIHVPEKLAQELEKRRLRFPRRVTDRGIHYFQKYDVAGGSRFSISFSSASRRALGWSNGAHGLRHSYAQQRLRTLLRGLHCNYETALETVSQELGHFRPDITNTYLR